jgi:serine phosphatase RsbU (regulator of sigma subunit)
MRALSAHARKSGNLCPAGHSHFTGRNVSGFGAAQKSEALMPGDSLLIFSDGIPEAANSTEGDFGDERLLRALTRSKHDTAAAICGRIVDEV